MRIDAHHQLLGRWHELEASGVPLEPMRYRTGFDGRDSSKGLVIEQQGERASNIIFVLKNYCPIQYMLDPFIRCDLPGETVIRDVGLVVPWKADLLFQWLPDPAEEGPKDAPYLFPGKNPIPYPRDKVLNHKMCRVLRRGGVLQGLLLGVGYTPPPKRYSDGAEIEIILEIVDHWGHLHSAPFLMWLHRSVTRGRPIRKTRVREKLYDTADDRIDSLAEQSR